MICLLIADDHAIVREGIKKILALSADIAVTGEAVDGAGVLQHLRRADDFDLLLLDLTMPGIDGISLIRHIKACHAGLPILVFSMHSEPQIAFRALQAGADGYVIKDSDPETLLAAIYKVVGGGRYIDPVLAERLAFDAALPKQCVLHTLLSEREFEVFRLLVAGKRINDIAEHLAISNKTVSTHKQHLLEKMKIDNLADLVRYAAEHSLFS